MNKIEKQKKLIKAIASKGSSLEAEMSFFEHIDVLRMHLLRVAFAIVIFTCLAFVFYDFIFNEIILGPKKTNFWTYRVMRIIGEKFKLGSDFFVFDIPFNIINTEMGGQFTLQMNSCLLIGFILAFPYLLFELWRFLKPALSKRERQNMSGFIFYATILFLIGITFGYFIITPLSINFLANFKVSDLIQNQITIDSYLSTVATLTLVTGIIFELPVLIFILSKIGLVTAKLMRLSRRYAIFAIIVIAAIVTPTSDALTMITVSFPMLLLYEMSILISHRIEKRRLV